MYIRKLSISLFLLIGFTVGQFSWAYGVYTGQTQQKALQGQTNPQQLAIQVQQLNQEVQNLRTQVNQLQTKVQQLQQSQNVTDQRLKPVENFQRGYMGKPFIRNP